MVPIDRTSNGWPGVLERENSFDVITLKYLSTPQSVPIQISQGIVQTHLSTDSVQDEGLDTEEGDSGRARLSFDGTRERR